MLEQIKQLFNKWYDKTTQFGAEGCYIRASVTFLVPPVIIALALIFLGLGISAVVNFLRRHYAQLIMAALGLWAFAAWWDKHKAEKFRREQEEKE